MPNSRAIIHIMGALLLILAAGASHAQDAGDTCDKAGVLTQSGSYAFDTTGASGDDPCAPGLPTVWYKYTATADGIIEVDLCGSSFNTYLTIFEGAACPGGCNPIKFADDECGDDASTTLNVVNGQTYYFAINGDVGTDFGPGVFNLRVGSAAGDTCASAGILTESGTYFFDTTGAPDSDPCAPGFPTVWYKFTAPADGVMSVDLCGSSFDTYLTVFETEFCPQSCAGFISSDDVCGDDAAIVRNVQAGDTFHFAINGSNISQFGPGVLNFGFATTAGDNCEVPIDISEAGNYPFTLTSESVNDLCFPDSLGKWFRFTAPSEGKVSFDSQLTGKFFITAIYDGTSCPTTCDSILGVTFPASKAALHVEEGERLLVLMLDETGTPGDGVLRVAFQPGPPPLGETCGNPFPLTENGIYPFDTNNVTFDTTCAFEPSRTVWFDFVAPINGVILADTCGSSYNTFMTVYAGESCPTGCTSFVAVNNDSCGLQSSVRVFATAGTRYRIAVAGLDAQDAGIGALNFAFVPRAGNTCATAGEITTNGTYPFNTLGASGDDPCAPGFPTVWYKFTAPDDGTVEADLCNTSFSSFLTMFTGPDCPVGCGNDLQGTDVCGDDSGLTFEAVAGQTYYFAINGDGAAQFGPGDLNFVFTPTGTLGDINGDGLINVADVTELGNLLRDNNPPSLAVGDVDPDGVVDEMDLHALAKMVVDQ